MLYLNKNFTKSLTLQSVADSFHISKDYCCLLYTSEFAALPQAFVANSYEPYNPVYKYNSIFSKTISDFDWQAVYGHISAEDYVDAIIKQVNDSISQQ